MEHTPLRDVLAVNLRRLRQEAGLSQSALGDRSGLHRTYISDIERSARNVSLASIEVLAKALGVSVAELLTPGEGTTDGSA